MHMARHHIAAAMLFLVAGTTGCATPATVPPTTPASPTPPTATSAPSPTPSAAAGATCENLLNPETLAALLSSGQSLTPPADFGARMQAEGHVIGMFADNGGVVCQWSPAGSLEANEVYGFSRISAAQAAAQQARLAGEGLTTSTHNGGTILSDLTGNENVIFEYLFIDGYWFCAINVARLSEIVANAPL